jgi:hypothetical protein
MANQYYSNVFKSYFLDFLESSIDDMDKVFAIFIAAVAIQAIQYIAQLLRQLL